MDSPKIKFSPALKVSIGLIALIMGWIMLIQILIGVWPDQAATLKEIRERTSENLAIQSAILLQSGNLTSLKETLEEAMHRDNNINSIGIRTKQNKIALQIGDHQRYWKPLADTKSTLDYIRVEIKANHQHWGDIEIAFQPAFPQSFIGWISQPMALSLWLLVIGGLVLYSFYLRKVFVYLDPSSTIPDRVSIAFDSFSEGVMMVDKTGRIVLANKTLRQWVGEKDPLFGKMGKDLVWLKKALRKDPRNLPWMKAMETQEPINGLHLEFQKSNGETNKAILNCSPIQDAANNVRGCLITFDNVTEIDRINKELTLTMERLYASQIEIEKRNTELIELATRDPLTNCLNRRAFFEEADKVLERITKTNGSLSCIMADIDHFKLFNDRFGHAIGDKVLVAFSRSLFSGLRVDDLLARYGGEEFCILLPETALELALKIAERLRSEVESQAGSSIRSTKEINITSSFGVATLSVGTPDLAVLIDRADKALYAAKTSGRNCVRVWDGLQIQ